MVTILYAMSTYFLTDPQFVLWARLFICLFTFYFTTRSVVQLLYYAPCQLSFWLSLVLLLWTSCSSVVYCLFYGTVSTSYRAALSRCMTVNKWIVKEAAGSYCSLISRSNLWLCLSIFLEVLKKISKNSRTDVRVAAWDSLRSSWTMVAMDGGSIKNGERETWNEVCPLQVKQK